MSERIITCTSCGQEKKHRSHQLCRACFSRWERAGRPAAGPPPRSTGRWEEYRELTRDQHYTLKNAAARMGISTRTAERHEARLRAMDMPPADCQAVA